MTPEKRQRLLLGVLVVLAALLILRWVGGYFFGGGGAGIIGARGTADSMEIPEDVSELRLADLEHEAAAFRIGRDPFRFWVRRKSPPKRAAPVERPPAPPPPPRSRRAARVEPKPPPVDVVFLGSFGPRAKPIGVFSDGSELFNVRQGGVLKENFVVDQIGLESADLKFVNFPNEPAKRLAVGG